MQIGNGKSATISLDLRAILLNQVNLYNLA